MAALNSTRILEPNDFFRNAEKPLPQLLDWLRRDLANLRAKYRDGVQYINSNAGVSFEPVGVAMSHPRNDFEKSYDPYSKRDWCVLHWSSIFKYVDDAVYLEAMAPLAIVWHFRELFERWSVAFTELFRRKIVEEIFRSRAKITQEEKLKRGMKALSRDENTRYYSLLRDKFGTQEHNRRFFYALTRSFKEALKLKSAYADDMKRQVYPYTRLWRNMKKDIGIVDDFSCMPLSLVAVKECGEYWEQSQKPPRIKGIDPEDLDFNPKKVDDQTYEFSFIEDMALPCFGASRVGPEHIAINLREFLKYRASKTDYYKKLSESRSTRYNDLDTLVVSVREYWEKTCSHLFGAGEYRHLTRQLENLWGEDAGQDVVFLNTSALRKRRAVLRRLERNRSKLVKMGDQALKKVRAAPPKLYILQAPSPSNSKATIKEPYRFHVIRRRRGGVFWGVPWEIPEWARHDVTIDAKELQHLPPEDLPRKKGLKKGITYIPEYERYFYTYETLFDMRVLPNNPVRNYRYLREWMKHIATCSPREFKVYTAGLKKEAIDEVQRSLYRQLGRSLKGVPWTPLEDNAIKRYYRPGMTLDDEEKLTDICCERGMSAISKRAAFLREQMLEDGIYSLELLPHRNYNVRLRRRIAEMKRKATAKFSE